MTLHRFARITWRWPAALLIACALGGCNGEGVLNRIVRPQDDAFARAFLDSLRLGRIEYATQRLSPALWQLPGVRDSLALLATHLPHGALDSMRVVGANRFTNESVDRSVLTYEYHSAQGWGVATINILNQQGIHYINGMRADTLSRSLEVQNAFTLRGKSAGHYLMLMMVIGCAVTAMTVAIRAARTPMRRHWWWALFSLVGTGSFAFNWTTGQAGFSLLAVRIAAWVGHGVPAAPWILSLSFPIGALMTLRRIQQERTRIANAAAVLPVSVPDNVLPAATRAASVSLPSDEGRE